MAAEFELAGEEYYLLAVADLPAASFPPADLSFPAGVVEVVVLVVAYFVESAAVGCRLAAAVVFAFVLVV